MTNQDSKKLRNFLKNLQNSNSNNQPKTEHSSRAQEILAMIRHRIRKNKTFTPPKIATPKIATPKKLKKFFEMLERDRKKYLAKKKQLEVKKRKKLISNIKNMRKRRLLNQQELNNNKGENK